MTSTSSLPSELKAAHDRLSADLPFFARHVLRIKPKTGPDVPLVFNSAQQYIHSRLEDQKRRTGRVRMLLIKGRQQGASTYIAARNYHRAVWNPGTSVFILSHEAETTKKLFRIVERFHDLSPEPVRPVIKVSNRKEIRFQDIGSEYTVGTAGNENVGRGGTVQLFHGSEVAFWERTDQIQAGVLQSVPGADDTEVVLESTANGMNNMFYHLYRASVEGKSEYEVCFTPWYWQDEYVLDQPHDGNPALTEDEREYRTLYKLNDRQIYWRRAKTSELGSEWLFKQEYPAFVQEAFQTSGHTLISAQRIMAARHADIQDRYAPLLIGVDPGRNRDRTVFVHRRGRCVEKVETFKFTDEDQSQMHIAGLLANRIRDLNPARVFIDVGSGYGVIDRLGELGFSYVITAVAFGSQSAQPEVYANKRAEMWCALRDWLHGEGGPVSLPDRDDIQADLMSVPEVKPTSNGKVQLQSKDQIRKISGFSPDIGDAMALTFAHPVAAPGAVSRAARVSAAPAVSPFRSLRWRGQKPKVSAGGASGVLRI